MKLAKIAALAVGMLLVGQATASAQGTAPAPAKTQFFELTGIGMGLVIIGAGLGIGGLTRAALESMARQPEVANNIQTAMIISAALIEGVTFTALILMYLRW
jgi:F-type H+-transporting ATPase subunit c